ncbi:unnamed protein product [Nezara viridula]|uniref:Uncharacterized protein n=1 Tax=Nezara viridula TaxID=85310 RepID=A0A9P0EHJ2_NEZVI|nr:unnamed protein product [Nezara viridula]
MKGIVAGDQRRQDRIDLGGHHGNPTEDAGPNQSSPGAAMQTNVQIHKPTASYTRVKVRQEVFLFWVNENIKSLYPTEWFKVRKNMMMQQVNEEV